MALATINKIDIGLEGKNSARLAMKEYSREYTNVPNSVLPEFLRNDLSEVYSFLTGSELPLNDYTFLIKAKDGRFSKVYSPAVYVSKLDNSLVIKWGANFIPVVIADGALKLSNGKKCKLTFKQEKVNGYDNPVLSLVFTNSDKQTYSMAFPVRLVSLDDEITSDELEVFLENEEISSLMDAIQEQPSSDNSESDSYNGSGEKLLGDIIKVSDLPVGQYQITAIRRYKNSYGIQHLLQTSVEDVSALVSSQNDDGNWSKEEKVSNGKVILKANNRLNKLLLSDPVVSKEKPAILRVLEVGEFNGYRTVKVDLECDEYTVDKDILDLNF